MYINIIMAEISKDFAGLEFIYIFGLFLMVQLIVYKAMPNFLQRP